MPIRPVINNINAPACNLAKLLNQQLHILLPLPNTYTVKNTNEIAQEIIKIPINEQIRMMTLDIKDMYVKLPTEGILRAAKTGLKKTANSLQINKQVMILLSIIMEQNYFQYNKQCYKPQKGIAMVSPVSGYLAEIYIQKIEETDVKHWLESKEIIYYKRYVDDIFILYNQSKTNEMQILDKINKISKHLQTKLNTEKEEKVQFLDLTVSRKKHNMSIDI
jgi:hypothetical protein